MATTLADKLLLPPKLLYILTSTAYAAITGLFRGAQGAPTYGQHVFISGVRTALTNLTVGQAQWIMPPFLQSYKQWCTKNNVKPDVVDIPNSPDLKCFWLGSKSTAKYTMVYYHGGGFVLPGGAEHINMLLNFIKWSNNNLAIFCVCYTLSPEAVYPVALGQCVEALRYIVELAGHSPETTLLGGDSAGGNLAIAVLSHVSNHPHPQSDKVRALKLSASIKAAVLIAPWTSSDVSRYSSMTKYANRDLVNSTCANYWIATYKGGKDVVDDEYVCATLASAEWWRDTKCEEMLVTAGEQETLVDAITHWVDNYKQGTGRDSIKYVIGKREVHDAPLYSLPESELIKLGESSQEGAIRLWIKERLT